VRLAGNHLRQPLERHPQVLLKSACRSVTWSILLISHINGFGGGLCTSKDSVTSDASSAGVKRYRQVTSLSDARRRNANSRPRSATTTQGVFDHLTRPRRFRALKRAPSTGPRDGSSHSKEVVCGLYSPIRVTLLTTRYTRSAGAST
jgi:hypothetical protein